MALGNRIDNKPALSRARPSRPPRRYPPEATTSRTTTEAYIPQKHFFSTDTGKAFTTVLAGFAFTITSLPNTSLFPAFVAGFSRVLIMHTPGKVNLPTDFTCFVPTTAKASMIFEHSFGFSSVFPANSWHMADLVMALTLFIVFFITMGATKTNKERLCRCFGP